MEKPWRMNMPKTEKICILILVAIPFIVLSYMTYAYSVDIPKRDEWEIAGLLDSYYKGALTWYDLFEQHNEHRLFFPYLIMLPTAIASDWDVRYWIAFNVVFGLGIFVLLALQTLSTSKIIKDDKFLWLLPLFSFLVFSLRQHDNWLMGFQIIAYMNVFCTTASILLLARLPLKPTAFVAAVVLGFVGSFSFASGMLIWPIGFLVVWFNQTEKHLKKIYVIAWILISVSAVLLYLYDYNKPSHHPSLNFALKSPLDFFVFVFSYLAAPLVETKSIVTPLIGLSGTAVLVYATTRLWRSSTAGITVMLPYLGLGLYSFLNAIIIAVGRTGWGIQESLNSRYVTHTFFFWVALAVILFLYFSDCLKNTVGAKRRIISSASLYVITGLTLWAACASFKSIPWFFENYIHAVGLRCEIQISTDEDFELGKVNYTYHKAFTTIREHKLAVFRNQ